MRIALAAASALILGAPSSAVAAPSVVLAPPPAGQIYHAANPDFGGPENKVSAGRIHAFERLAGRHLAWAYFSNNWTGGIGFPATQVRRIRAARRLPFIRLMARSGFREGHADPNYSMQSIIDGDWDNPTPGSDGLERWCRDAAATGTPLLAEFGTEVNGSWFPWNGRWNGGGQTTGYGDPGLADGPERFRDAYRHIISLCRLQGATNITWFFHVDVGSQPDAGWNRTYANYYPGDAYIDWIGLSDYGSLSERWSWDTFRERLDPVYDQLTGLAAPAGKPIAVLEYGTREDAGQAHHKASWIHEALRDIRRRYPAIDAASWWNEKWGDRGETVDIRINSSRPTLRAYRRAVANPAFTAKPRFVPR